MSRRHGAGWEHRTGIARSITDWRSPRLERAIGVIYRPETEYLSHYFEAVLADQFDALVWFDTTSDVKPLPHQRPVGAVETYPFGL